MTIDNLILSCNVSNFRSPENWNRLAPLLKEMDNKLNDRDSIFKDPGCFVEFVRSVLNEHGFTEDDLFDNIYAIDIALLHHPIMQKSYTVWKETEK